jgi:dCTP deaminase
MEVADGTWGMAWNDCGNCGGIHPGYAGSLTLELRNLGGALITLYPGQTIAQLFFHQVIDQNGNRERPYTESVDMVPQRLSSEITHRVLEKFVKKNA